MPFGGLIPYLNPMKGSMTGMEVANPAANPGEDVATRMMLQLAGELAAPQAPPSTASPLAQLASLFAANAGSQLLQQPGGARPAQEAVATEMGKPEQFRLEQQRRFDKSQHLRLD